MRYTAIDGYAKLGKGEDGEKRLTGGKADGAGMRSIISGQTERERERDGRFFLLPSASTKANQIDRL